MKKFLLCVDSCCDLEEDYCHDKNIYALHMHCTIGEELCEDTMRAGDIRAFYDRMKQGERPLTSQIPTGRFLDFWTPLLEQQLPILYIAMDGAISGTVHNGIQAAESLTEDHPDADIRVVDSTTASGGYAYLALGAAAMRDEGKSIDETVEWLDSVRHRVHACCTTDDLTYLYRGGRVSRAKMVIARALGICPILDVSYRGDLRVIDKVRGADKVLNKMTEYIRCRCIDPEQQTLYMCHGDDPEKARLYGEHIQKTLGFRDIRYSLISSTIGAHTGPGLIAVFYTGKERVE